jgi:hypothetical protein
MSKDILGCGNLEKVKSRLIVQVDQSDPAILEDLEDLRQYCRPPEALLPLRDADIIMPDLHIRAKTLDGC